MAFALLELVVLTRDLPELGLRPGDLGTVVEVYERGGLEVEFVQPNGATKALATLDTSDFRGVTADDVLTVRPQ